MIRSIARLLFEYRSYTPIPLIAILLVVSDTGAIDLLAGAAVASVGEAIRIWALRHAGPKTRTHRKIRVGRLVDTGPYSVVRNPLYIGNFILSLGICIASGRPILIVPLVIAFGFQYTFIIRAEEEFLEGTLGDAYREYRNRVPRMFPRPGLYRAGEIRFPFREILPRELNTITAAETVLALLGLRILFPGIPEFLPGLLGS